MITAAAESGANPLSSFLLLIPIFAVFYFLMIRPQNKRRREQLQMQSSVEPGSRVLTTNGMYATVVEVDDDGLVLEIAPGVEARFVKQAVMQVLTDDEDLESDEADDAEDSDESDGEAVDADESVSSVSEADETVTGEAGQADETAAADEADEATGPEPRPGAKSLAKSGNTAEKTSDRPSA